MPWNAGIEYETPAGEDMPPAKEGFRARYKYHLEDPAYAAFLSHTPVFNVWDDHEVVDDWGTEKLVLAGQEQLLKDGVQAFFEYWPVRGPLEEPNRPYRNVRWGKAVELFILDCRSYRSVHDATLAVDDGTATSQTPQLQTILGAAQLKWLKHALTASDATWRIICSSVPLSYQTGWPRPLESGFDGWSDGRAGTASGPELELYTF
mmetsp:Transcript_5641/g.20057  ORF Transcript_5641/g.20057 Transcript_5641/m.20057 type:complete len:206 (-) Transcript_5641:373-990(-)